MSKVSFPRSFARLVLTLCAAAFVPVATLLAQTPSAADGFDPNVNGNVYASALQPDGGILIAGQFNELRPNGSVTPVARTNIARLRLDGSVDGSFDVGTDGPVRVLVRQPDGKILIGGQFTQVVSSAGVQGARNNIARLNVDGSLDTSFNPNITGATQPVTLKAVVNAIVVQSNGDIVVGGNFSFVQPPGASSPIARRHIARFTAAGALDVGYNPNPNNVVLALVQHLDGRIVAAGGFTSFQENGKPTATTRNRIARLNVDGSLDTTFDPNADNRVVSLAVQRDGKLILGGDFTALYPAAYPAGAFANRLARLNADGTFDGTFTAEAGATVSTIALQPDGSLIIGGGFSAVSSRGSSTVVRNAIARIAADGSIDRDFAPGLNAEASTISVQADGKIVVGGYFTTSAPPGATVSTVRNHLARFNSNGTLDASFELNPGGRPLASITQTDGKIVIAGSFSTVGGAIHNYLARLNADGTVDSTYNPTIDGRVLVLSYDTVTGKLIIGGQFIVVNGLLRNHIARLNADGSVDAAFDPNINGEVDAITVQSDGKILVAGQFGTVQPPGESSALTYPNLLRLNSDGSLDKAFKPVPNAAVSAMVVQADGKIIVTGLFSGFSPNLDTNTTFRSFLARLNSDGTVEAKYQPDPNGQISSMALQSDGKLLVVGQFSGFNTVSPVASLTLVNRIRIARLNTDGSLDTAYTPSADAPVLSLALQADGKAIIGGYFREIIPSGGTLGDSVERKFVARLGTDGSVDKSLDLGIGDLAGVRVDSLRLQGDGRLLVGGNFETLQPTGSTAAVLRKAFARINADGTLDNGFQISAGGQAAGIINAVAVQADGKVVVGGSFTELGGARNINLVRFNPEGSVDSSFSVAASTDGAVNAIAVRPNSDPTPSQLPGFAWLDNTGALRSGSTLSGLALRGTIAASLLLPDGRLLIAGNFVNLTGATYGNIARFNADGSLDASFNPSIAGQVLDMARQSDGKLLVAGAFTNVNGIDRAYLARLNPDGSVDESYNPIPNTVVTHVIVQPDDKAIITGSFTALRPNNVVDNVNRLFVARLKTDGTVDDANFNPNGQVNAVALQPDGKIVIGGLFTSAAPNGALVNTTRNHLARFNADGSLDDGFDADVNGPVSAIAIQANGGIVFGGTFTSYLPRPAGVATVATARNNIARINADSTPDFTFDPNANGSVASVAVQPDGKIVFSGTFTTVQPNGAASASGRNHLARVLADGRLDTGFNPYIAGTVLQVVAPSNGTVLVSGDFTGIQNAGFLVIGGAFGTIGGTPTRYLAIVNEDGSVNPFSPLPDGAVNAVLALSDGRFVVGGAFTTISGTTRNRIARFSAAGVLDTSFSPVVNGPVRALALQPDGKVLLAGQFTALGGVSRPGIARLNADGSLDASFQSTSTATTTALALQPDGRVLVITEGLAASQNVLRLNADGTLDSTFATFRSSSPSLTTLALQADGKVLVGGSFTSASSGGNAANGARLVRLNSDGSVDTTFNPAPNGAVTSLALQTDGRIIIGGGFTTVGGLQRVSLARLAPTGFASQVLGVSSDHDTIFWSRSGTTAELSAARFEISGDGQTWTVLGEGSRLNNASTWQITGVSSRLPARDSFYIRARGIAPSSAGSSSGLVQSVRQFNLLNLGPSLSSTGATVALAGNQSISINAISGQARLAAVSNPQTWSPSLDGTVDSADNTSSVVLVSRMANISARGVVNASTPLISGFFIEGTQPRSVLIRGIGPGLQPFGVTGALGAARLRVYDSAQQVVASNDGWDGSAAMADTFARVGAFPLTPGSADAALVVSLAPGSYTVQVLDGANSASGGIALVEAYDAGGTALESRLSNLSNRGTAIAGDGAFIGGFVLTGNASKRLLVRGVGPGLTKFNVTGVLADPHVALFDSAGRMLAANDDWSATDLAAAISTAASGSGSGRAALGAFTLDTGSKDAALIVTLAPGAYTVHVSGPDATARGAALMELYELP